jgi:polyhydroxyalkanoate synthesis regulator phasin
LHFDLLRVWCASAFGTYLLASAASLVERPSIYPSIPGAAGTAVAQQVYVNNAATMVLRGSKIKPEESLRELQAAIKVAESALESTIIEIEEARQDAYEQLADEDVDQMTSQELRSMVNSLRTRVAQLEEQQQEDARLVEQRYAQLTKTVQQLGAGGVAGAIARSFVAPIDRVKILMQTSYITGNEAKFGSIAQTGTIDNE